MLIMLWMWRSKSKDSLKKSLSNIMHEWAHEVAQLLDGKVDVRDFLDSSSTAGDDVQWLSSRGAHRYDLLPSYSLHRHCTQSLLEGLTKGSFFTISEDSDGLLPEMDLRKLQAAHISCFCGLSMFTRAMSERVCFC